MDAINNPKSIKSGDKCQNVFSQARILNRYDVTYIISVLGLGLASQEVDVFDKSANEITWKLYGYKEMTQPQLFIQTQIQNRQDVIIIRVSRVS